MNVNLIVNPIAGRRAFVSLQRIEDLLRDKVSLTTLTTQKKGDAFSFAKNLPDADLIIVAGGDGTFNEVMNGVLSLSRGLPEPAYSTSRRPADRLDSQSGARGGQERASRTDRRRTIPIALIPLGTTNVLAKELGIPENVEDAIEIALNNTPKTVSLGRITITRQSPASLPARRTAGGREAGRASLVTRYFCLMAGIGFDGSAVFRINDKFKRISGKGAYILSGVKTLIQYNPPLIEIKSSEGIFTGYMAVIGKAKRYGGHFQVTPEASLTEPLLDLCLLKSNKRIDLLRFIQYVITKKHLSFNHVFYGKFPGLEVSSKEPVHIQIDGDYLGTLPAKIDVVRDAVSLIW